MPHQRLKPEIFLDEERLEALKDIIPEAFADNKINWSTLKNALGGELEDEEKPDEHFGLFWPGKREARKLASRPSKGTLIPVKGEGIKEETTRNIFIEGENLEVLKILRKSYTGRIKMIYIDPPYNTGNDFVYDDDFTEPLNDYLKRTGQIDGEGRPLTTNKKADGRFHSKWLSMMYPRLRLARELLRDDGVIFVSIDDNEVHHLRMMMNEVFGEENYLANIAWKHTQQSKNDEPYFSRNYNAILCFRKSDELKGMLFPRSSEDNKNYSNPDNDPKGDWRSGDVRSPNYRKTLIYDIETPSGNIISPPDNGWRWTKEEVLKKIDTGEIVFSDDELRIIRKIYLCNQLGRTPENVWAAEDFGTTRIANAEIKGLFDGITVFDTPKPSALVKKMLQTFHPSTCGFILDFFSGSATTAHAVIDLNREDGGNRKFILVQMPEATDEKSEAFKAGYKNIAEIGKERIRRVIKKIEAQRKEELPGLSDENKEQDLGFKVFKLTTSNYKPWENYHGESIEKVQELFEEYQVPLVDNWKEVEDGLFTEILLLEGFPLDSIVTGKSEYTKNRIRQVKCSFHENRLLVCLDYKLASETIRNLELADGDTFVCLDTAIDDQAKSRLADKGMIKTI